MRNPRIEIDAVRALDRLHYYDDPFPQERQSAGIQQLLSFVRSASDYPIARTRSATVVQP
jgi:hypothetical protein